MSVEVEITRDGYIHTGANSWWPLTVLEQGQSRDGTVLVKGSWVRFSDLQAAVNQQMSALEQQVLTVVNPSYAASREDREAQMEHRITQHEEQRIAAALANCAEEHLPLPTTLVRNEERKVANSSKDDGEHLPLPSTFRPVIDHRQQVQTFNRNCPTCQEPLTLPSTMRKRAS